MKVIKGIKLNNRGLTIALALVLSGCGGSDSIIINPVDTDSVGTDPTFIASEFVLISSAGEVSDIDFTIDYTVGSWGTGSEITDSVYEGLDAWEVKSGSVSAEAGNWGTVLVFQDGIDGDFSLFNSIDLKLATSGGYDQYKLSISGNGVGSEVIIPVDDSNSDWQQLSIDLSQFTLNLSDIDYIAVMGIGGNIGVSKIYITDYNLVKNSSISTDTDIEDEFIFKSSDSEVTSSLIVDDDNASNIGNVIFGEWSTGTMLVDTTYNGLASWQLSAVTGWGAVLALQGDISDGTNVDNYDTDFSKYTNIKFKIASDGNFERYALSIVSKSDTYEASQEVGFNLAEQSEWNAIDIDLDSYGVDLSNVSQVVVFGVYKDGTPASQKIYITDFIAYDSGIPTLYDKDSSDDKFVFISSSEEQNDLIVDGDNTVNEGNISINDWSTGTSIDNEVVYDNLSSWRLKKGAGWGAVVAMAGDIYGGVMPYKLDFNVYSKLNFKIAADGIFTSYEIAFVTASGAELKLPITVNSDWNDISFNLADLPLNLNSINQIAIYGIGGNTGNNIYITDFNIQK